MNYASAIITLSCVLVSLAAVLIVGRILMQTKAAAYWWLIVIQLLRCWRLNRKLDRIAKVRIELAGVQTELKTMGEYKGLVSTSMFARQLLAKRRLSELREEATLLEIHINGLTKLLKS